MHAALTIAFSLVAAVLAYQWLLPRSRKLPLPPGPKGLPIVGNVRDLSYQGKAAWVCYAEWAAKYGDVVYLNIIGQHIVILNSVKATTELLEKRSSNYSSRPGMCFVLKNVSF